MKKSYCAALAAAMLLTVPGGVYAAEEVHELSEVVVTGEKDKTVLPGGFVKTEAGMGLLGNKDVMDTPFSVTSFTAKTIEKFGGPDKPQDSIFAASPSVRQNGSILHGDFYFRGFRTNGTNYYVNGVPGVLTQFNTPTHIFENIDLISGANVGLFGTGVQYETTSPGGVVSAVTKKAPDEGVFTYTQTISGRGLFGEYLDWGKRFGKDKEWGVRVMTENLNGKTSVKGTKLVGQSIYANIDHRSEHTKDNLFIGYRNLDIQGGIRWFQLKNDVITNGLPSVPAGKTDYGYDGMLKSTHGWMAVYNHEQKFNEHWDGFVNLGIQDNNLDNNAMAKNSRYTLSADGTISGNYSSGGTPQKYYYWQVGTTAHYNTGALKHDITLSYNQAWRNRKSGYGDTQTAIIGSLAEGITSITPDRSYKTHMSNKTRVKSIGIVDSMKYNKWDFILGVHKHEAKSQVYNYDKTYAFTGITTTKADATSPTYGLVYKPNDNWSIYGSHSEYFDAGVAVSSTYINEGVLPPLKTKQNEIGVKYKKNGLLYTLAYYDIKQDSTIDVTAPAAVNGRTKYKIVDGEARHKGVEFSVNGRISDKWSMFGAISHLDAKQGGTYAGKKVNGTSEWTAALGLQYEPNEYWSILGRAVYTGESPLFNEQVTIPGYVIYDLGVSHKTKIGNIPATISLMCYNVFDKDYWMASRYENWVYLSTPRTFTLTAQLSF